MKLWKKIVLIGSTLIVIISSMVLPCFAGTFYSGDYEYTEIDTIAPEINWYTADGTVSAVEARYSAVFDTGLVTNDPIRRSQSWRNETAIYRLRDSTAIQPQTVLKHLDIYNTEEIQGHILSTYNITQIGDRNWVHLGETYLPFTELTLTFNNYVDDGLQSAYIYIPDNAYRDIKYTITYEAERVIFNKDTGEVNTEPYIFTRQGETRQNNRFIYIVASGDAYFQNIRLIQHDNYTDYRSNYLLFNKIKVKLEPSEATSDIGYTFIDGMSITIPSKVTYTTEEAEEAKRYINPLDIHTYQNSIYEIMKEEGFFSKNEYVTADFSDIWDFIGNSISGFFNFQLIPGITVGGIFATIFIILMGIVLLKVFAGG